LTEPVYTTIPNPNSKIQNGMTNSSGSAYQNEPNQPKVIDSSIDITIIEGKNYRIDQSFTWLVYSFAALTVLVLFWMSWVIYNQAHPAIIKFGLGFLWSQDWDVPNQLFGALPYIYGTLVSSAIAILLAIPVGLAVSLVTSEDFLPEWVRSTLVFVVELIAAIPSVIIGLWGIFVFIPFIEPLQKWLAANFNWIPIFNSIEPSGLNMLTAGIILAIMILPTQAAISREVLLVIPKELRSASMALGGTRWETIFRVLLPAGFSGIVGATMLALGRALGETMAVTMVIGNSSIISASLLEPAYSIPALLANEFAEAESGLHVGSLTYLALILFVLTLAVNIAAVLFVQVVGSKNK
jgi:phosphate transport system permease protein